MSEVKENKELEVIEIKHPIVSFKDVVGDIPESNAMQIKRSYFPMVIMLKSFEEQYEKISNMEITEESCKLADDLRKKIKKVRTSANNNRKEQKAKYLRAGTAVDNVYKTLEDAVVLRESKLQDMANYYENLTKQIIKDNLDERMKKFRTLDPDFVEPAGLGEWEEDHFKMIFDATEQKYIDSAIEVQRLDIENKENKRVSDLQTKRVIQCSRIAYLIEDFENIPFGKKTDEEYKIIVDSALSKERLEIEEEAYLYNIAFDDEKVLTDKADLFVAKLLKDGYVKGRTGYIKSGNTVSYESLKTLNQREFKGLIKKNNDLIKNARLIIEIEAYAYNDRINEAAEKLKIQINLSWTEAIEYNKQFDVDLEIKKLASSSDKVKLNKFAEDLESFINKYTIDLESVEAQDSFKYSISRIEEHIKDIIVLSDNL